MSNSEFDNIKLGDFIAYNDDPAIPRCVVVEKGTDWVKLAQNSTDAPETFTRKEIDSAFCRLNAPVTTIKT